VFIGYERKLESNVVVHFWCSALPWGLHRV